jgi:Tol biopolymer transport system component
MKVLYVPHCPLRRPTPQVGTSLRMVHCLIGSGSGSPWANIGGSCSCSSDSANGSQSHSADIYIMEPSNQRKKPILLLPKGVDKVNNIGRPAAGEYIVYNCNWSELCISSIKNMDEFRMYARPEDKREGRFQEPTFDPTSDRIVFEWTKQEDEQADKGTSDICTMNRDGSNLKCAGYEGYNKQPAWSPKGDKIVFQRQCGEGCWQLWVAKTNDGTINKESTIRLAQQYRSNTDASWSPDGTKIVYSCGDGAKAQVCISDADMEGGTTVVSGLDAPYNGAVSWCNDGYIYFEAGKYSKAQQPTVICRVAVPFRGTRK